MKFNHRSDKRVQNRLIQDRDQGKQTEIQTGTESKLVSPEKVQYTTAVYKGMLRMECLNVFLNTALIL